MPRLPIPPYGEIDYAVSDFMLPWEPAQDVVCVHGFAESMLAWNPWVPHLARNNRVVRYDQRGFGRSTPMPVDFPWTLDLLADDLMRVADAAAPGPVHLVAAKSGGHVAVRAARNNPDRVKSVTLCSTPPRVADAADSLALIKERGMRAYAVTTMPQRLKGLDQAAIDWWIELMAATSPTTALGFLQAAISIDVTDDLPEIRCPVLVLAVDNPKRPLEKTKAWQSRIPRSELVVVTSEAYHLALSDAAFCARTTSEFIDAHA